MKCFILSTQTQHMVRPRPSPGCSYSIVTVEKQAREITPCQIMGRPCPPGPPC